MMVCQNAWTFLPPGYFIPERSSNLTALSTVGSRPAGPAKYPVVQLFDLPAVG